MTAVYSLVYRAAFLFAVIFYLPSFSFAAPVQTYDELLSAIHAAHAQTENRIKSAVNQAGLQEAWDIGHLIQEHLLLNQDSGEYSKRLFEHLAKDLDIGVGELKRKVEFAQAYPEAPVTIHLTWAHYKEIVPIHDPAARIELARQAEVAKWSPRKIRKEIKAHQFKTADTEAAVIAGRLAELKPGKPGFYKIVRVNGELKAKLGFDVYRDAPPGELIALEENQIISALGSYFDVVPDAQREDLYTYYAVVTEVVDGDTFHAAIDLGFGTTVAKLCKLRRIDAPELKAEHGEQAKAALEDILKRNRGNIIVKVTHGNEQDQYGRYLVDVFVNEKNIDQELIDTTLFTSRG